MAYHRGGSLVHSHGNYLEFSFRGDICADISKRLADQARQKDGFYENIDESHRALCGRIFEYGARRFRIPDRLRYAELDRDQIVVNLVINRPFERWNVAGIISLAEETREITVALSADLDLEEGDYLVHEYWSDTFYGVVSGNITVSVPARGCAVLAIRKKTGQLQMVSTSRHITQGAVDLLDVTACGDTLSGVSKVVRGDPYMIKAFDPKTGRLLEKRLLPENTGAVVWEIQR